MQREQLQEKWVRALGATIKRMNDQEILLQFVLNYFSDRSILYLQWVRVMYNTVYFRPKEYQRVFDWYDDILISPLAFSIAWQMPEHMAWKEKTLHDGFLQYGTISCFNVRKTSAPSYGPREHLQRKLSSLDGFTLMLLGEIIHRYRLTFSKVERPEYGSVLMTMELPAIPHQDPVIQDIRLKTFKHLLAESFVFPFLVVNIPDHEVSLKQGRAIHEITVATALAYSCDIMLQYLAYSGDSRLTALYAATSHLQGRSQTSIDHFCKEALCPCSVCTIIQRILNRYFAITWDDPNRQHVSTGMLVLWYRYNQKRKQELWHHNEDHERYQAALLLEQKQSIQHFIADVASDTYTLREFAKFKQYLTSQKKLKHR